MSRALEREPETLATDPSLSADDVAISVRDLSKRYRLEKVRVGTPHAMFVEPIARLLRRAGPDESPDHIWALDGLTFDVARGERVGIIGPNGAGKSTLLKILSRIVTPTRGEARIRGRVTSLLEVGTGFSNKLTGRENVYANAGMHGLSRREINLRFDEIVEFSGIESKFLDIRVKHYSSGMRLRLAFSVAAHLDPDILLLDEVLAVGDAAFQARCLERVGEMMLHKRTLLFVSHNMSAITRFCDRVIWLRRGRIVVDGPATDVAALYSEDARRSVSGRNLDEARKPTAVPDVTAAGEAAFAFDGTIMERASAALLSVRIVDVNGDTVKATTTNQKVGVEFVYDVFTSGEVILPAARFHTAEGIQIFSVVYTDPEFMTKPKAPGRYRSVVWLPAHFFNVGLVHVSVSLTTPASGKAVCHDLVDRALDFDVFESPYGLPSARGLYKGLSGVVRPMLDWETQAL